MHEESATSQAEQAKAIETVEAELAAEGRGGLDWRWMLFAGAAYGLAMRLVFGFDWFKNHTDSGAMLSAFVILVPFLIGCLSVYLAPPAKRTLTYSIFMPWLPLTIFVAGTAVLLIEGSICIAMAMPLFMGLCSVGGVLMWLILKAVEPSTSTMGGLLLLPLLAGAFERQMPPPPIYRAADASVHIEASPERVWRLINGARGISPQEMAGGLAWRIGVPYPLEAVTVATDRGRVRKLRWHGGVAFDEPILDWRENRYIRWRYVFDARSFPPGTLDEHVLIGGKHFDLVDTSYRLTPEGRGTRLDIRVNYRISTRFNWYAGAWGDWLVDNAAESILAFYKHRSEQAGDGA